MKNLYVSYSFEYTEGKEQVNSILLKATGIPKTVKQFDAVLDLLWAHCNNTQVAIIFWCEMDSDKPIKKTTGRKRCHL